MKQATELKRRIDSIQDKEDLLRGGHLPASRLGISCSRALWYGFRWAGGRPPFPARILRLFARGNRAEDIFAQLLEDAGVPFWSRDPATNDQYKVSFRNKHVAGYCDGIGRGLPDIPLEDDFVAEWKTHNDKSFKAVAKLGVQAHKPEHHTQLQLYLDALGIKWGLYGAVNKNDDDLYLEIVPYDKEHARYYLDRADFIVASTTPPERINNNPAWYECKFCDFRKVCHLGRPMDETCRSCQHVHPTADGGWWCGLHDKDLNLIEQRAGCPDHVRIEQ